MSWMDVAKAIVEDPAVVLTAQATILLAVATFLSAVFVGIQALYTRRTVKETASALKIAQLEFDRNSKVFEDAQKARIDAEMPRLTIEVLRQPSQAWDPQSGTDAHGNDGYATEYRSGHKFTMPRDKSLLVASAADIRITNDGPRIARFRVVQPLGRAEDSYELALKPRTDVVISVWRIHSVGEWLEFARPYIDGGVQPVDPAIFLMDYSSPGDLGATEHHKVIEGGSVLIHTPGDDAGYQITEWVPDPHGPYGIYPPLYATAQPFTRDYWASRLEDRRLE